MISDSLGIKGLVTVYVYRASTRAWYQVCRDVPNLVTNAGHDLVAAQMYTNTSAGTQGANYIAVTEDSAAAAAGDTTLASEISTNGLQRAQATTAHTTGTKVTTLDITFTASGTFSTGVQKMGTFNASSVGTLVNEVKWTPAVTMVSGDKIRLVLTITTS